MCKFFSFCSCGEGKYYFFGNAERKALLKENPHNYNPDSHASICARFGVPEDKANKYEYNFFTRELTADQINGPNDEKAALTWARNLDPKEIIAELIVKPIFNPFSIDAPKVTKKDIADLKKWASVWASVWDSVRDSVRASVWDSVRDSVLASVLASVWASVMASVRDSFWDSFRDSGLASVWAYFSSFFAIKYGFDFSCGIRLWDRGFMPVSYGGKWHLYGKKDGKVQTVYTLQEG